MRVIKVNLQSYERMVKAMGSGCRFIKIPSDNGKNFFTGLIVANGAYIAWPDTEDEDAKNGLNPMQMRLYIQNYGEPPELFKLTDQEIGSFTQVSKVPHED